MGFKVALQACLLASCAGVGGGVLSLRSTVRGVEALPWDEAYALRDASRLTQFGTHDSPTHRRVYAYRLDALMPTKFATEQVHSEQVLPRRGEQRRSASPPLPAAAAEIAEKERAPPLHPSLSPSLGSLYALHALESALLFRAAWLWHTFWDTYRVSDTFNVWYRTRPAWMTSTLAAVAAAPSVEQRERVIHATAEEVEKLSDGRYEALLETHGVHGAVIRGGPRASPLAQDGEAPLYGVRFDLPDKEDAVAQQQQQHPRPRSAPLYVLYVSAPYSSDTPTETRERLRMWADGWYSRWLAAHVVKSLAKM